MGMMLAIVVICFFVSLGTYFTTKYRIVEHVYTNFSGTFKLIGEGAGRHVGVQREQWLQAIEQLSDLKITQSPISEFPHTRLVARKLKQDKFFFRVEKNLSQSKAYVLLDNGQSYLSVTMNDFGSSLVRLSAFLMLNELGRHPSDKRLKALDSLRQSFAYPIKIKDIDSLAISPITRRTIQSGDIAVQLVNVSIGSSFLMAYTPLGNSPYALVLGPIPFFDWFPISLLVFIIVIILILMAIVCFVLVRPLENRLAEVDLQIDQIGHDKAITLSQPKGDAIGKLAVTVHAMAGRIHKLIDAQNSMVSAISHELRSPITRIRFRLHALEKPENALCLEGIERDLAELEGLIDEVLTFSKLKRDTPILTLETIELASELQQVINRHPSHSHRITVNIPMGLCVIADKRYFLRLLDNLFNNALRYAETHIEIGASFDDNHYTLWIKDDGPGMSAEQAATIFEPFTRVDSSRNRQSGGYGLGLAIVQQIAIWHGGSVYFDAQVKQGALVYFQWPTLNKQGEKE